jgi:DUF1680 family protein
MIMTKIRCLLAMLSVGSALFPAYAAKVLPEKIPPAVADRQSLTQPDQVQFTGWIGRRIAANEANRLVKIEPDRLLEGYRKRPGRQTWDGEHVGKWLHAATLAWVNTGDPALRERLDYTAAELMKCQLEDGYLGTYLEKDRWVEWDVWAHKYNLLGLITYMRYTGNTAPLPTCERMADLLIRTFGEQPGQRDIIKAGHHVGMAPTSVLEPMVLLYRLTGEPRYLEFCTYLLRSWEQPNGPKIVSTLLTVKRVDKVGNGKAYEMLSCLNGALEYYRTVGSAEARILEACLNAWQDIVDKRLYITGAASYGELFRDDYDLPNVNHVGETCVTVTWLQFNAQLLRLTGEARFAQQLEHVVLNQLFGAQQCDGSAWGYYVEMEGKKPYSSTLDGHCCLSSGPRGVALVPTFGVATDHEGVVVNLYDEGIAELSLNSGARLRLTTQTLYPADGRIRLAIEPASKQRFSIKLRIPPWGAACQVRVNGKDIRTKSRADGYVAIERAWKRGDQIELVLPLAPRVAVGDHNNAGKAAVLYGPLVLAADEALLPAELDFSLGAIGLAGSTANALEVRPEPAPERFKTWPGAQVFRVNAMTRRTAGSVPGGASVSPRLVPFADAGTGGTRYKVWLPIWNQKVSPNVLLEARESRSRKGNVSGSICDDEPHSFAVTFDGKPSAEDWFAVQTEGPVTVRRVVFAHGRVFHDGGWFDAGAGKPRVQVKRSKDAEWETVSELDQYPATTAASPAGLQDGQRFECRLPAPIQVWGVRIIGKPAVGDSPQQAFASCAELQAFEQ